MGEPLARTWLRPEVIEAAEAYRAALYGVAIPPRPLAPRSTARGRCQLLLVTTGSEGWPLLRPAFLLPVDWRLESEAGPSSPRLPRGLAAFAAAVLEDLGLTGLTLHVPKDYEAGGVDLSALDIALESAWAALAAGAAIFHERGATVADVLATAAWSRDHATGRGCITAVAGIADKLDAATEAGARVVFLPAVNLTEVNRWRQERPEGAGPEVRWLSSEMAAPMKAIGPLLSTLEVRPSLAAGADFEHCCAYYTRMPATEADAYYRAELLDEACRRVRKPDDPRLSEVTKLAVIVSQSLAVPCLLVRLFDPDHVLLLHDGGHDAAAIDRCRLEIESLGSKPGQCTRTVRVDRCDPAILADAVAASLKAFEAECPSGRLLVDLTPGYRAFNLALLAATPPEAVMTYVHSPQTSSTGPGRVRPGREELRIFRLPR